VLERVLLVYSVKDSGPAPLYHCVAAVRRVD
jgi:hypothetical protein